MDMFLQLTIYVAFDILPFFSFMVTYLSAGERQVGQAAGLAHLISAET